MSPLLQRLVQKAWAEFKANRDEPYVVRPSIPILYFGDLGSYHNSALRIITAALNPSSAEFPQGDRFLRFRQAEHIFPEILAGQGVDQYLDALNIYFHEQPYRRWFSALEPILQGMGVSFYPGAGGMAVHTDLCTPLATDPTWSRLPETAKLRLLNQGLRIWHELVDYLQPDVILMSVATRHVEAIWFPRLRPPLTVFEVSRQRPYKVTVTPLELASGKISHLVFGQAANTPFGLISNADKYTLGRAVLREVQDG